MPADTSPNFQAQSGIYFLFPPRRLSHLHLLNATLAGNTNNLKTHPTFRQSFELLTPAKLQGAGLASDWWPLAHPPESCTL